MIIENVQLAFSSLKSNKMRALLTMLGIIIGIMSIITIVVIGDAMTATVSDNLSSLGASNVTVSVQERSARQIPGMPMNFAQFGGSSRGGKTPESSDLISEKMIEGLKINFPNEIAGVSLSHSGGSARAQDGERYANVSITGTNADYFLANGLTLVAGRLTSDADVGEKAKTAVVSDRLAGRMFPDGADPVGRQIKIYKSNAIELYTVIGVYEYEQSPIMGRLVSEDEISTAMYVPVSTAKQDLLEKNFNSITVIGSPETDVQKLTKTLQDYFDTLYFVNGTWRANVSNMATMLDTITETLNTISLAIAFIAGISLVVGGIGVMNIMLVSVTERTREIGTRKALGAKNFHIRFQFVTEALIIALVGGIIGMALGVLLGWAVATVFGVKMVVSPFVIFGSMLFSMAIGVFFGLYPANRAAKLDPIEALRYE